MKFYKSKFFLALLALAVGLVIGGTIFGGGSGSGADEMEMKSSPQANGHNHGGAAAEEETTWTCSMHPQIKQPEPGDCPICGMELIPLDKGGGSDDPAALTMTENAVKIAGIETITAGMAEPEKTITLNGKFTVDERRIYGQIAHVSGRIEGLYVNFTGEKVSRGEKLATIYSPELVAAQRELFEAAKLKETIPGIYESAREKLRLWKLAPEQIDEIEKSGKIRTEIDVLADHSGYVMERYVSKGQHVNTGQPLFKIAGLGRLWIEFEVYEENLPFIKRGGKVTFEAASKPGQEFKTRINYIDPFIHPERRVAIARADVSNPGGRFKPETFVKGYVEAELPGNGEVLAVPKTAVMWTGPRSVLYVQDMDAEVPTFEMREVTLGPEIGESYIIKDGLEEGEEVVVYGTFNLDAAAQLNNKYSMMNREINVKGKKGENEGHEEMETMKNKIPDYKEETPEKFKKQAKLAVKAYLELAGALVETDARTAKKKAAIILKRLKKVDMLLLEGDAHEYWMGLMKTIKKESNAIASTDNIDKQRKSFISLSNAMIKTAKAFGADMDLYVQYCPMADNDSGASWLSLNEEILNPYFGDLMLNCGEVSEIIKD